MIKHSRKATSPPPSSDGETTEHPDEPVEPEEPDVDVEMVEEEIKPAPKKKKVKKVIPVGRNGLKKRRVVKSRMTTDAKGRMEGDMRFELNPESTTCSPDTDFTASPAQLQAKSVEDQSTTVIQFCLFTKLMSYYQI